MFRFYVLTEQRNELKAGNIHQKLQLAWGECAPGYSTVKRWMKDFKSEKRTSFSDAERPGRPVTVSTEENVAQIQELLHENPRMSTRDIECLTGIPQSVVHGILVEKLKLRNVCSVWIPHDLTAENKALRVTAAKSIRSHLLRMGEDRYDKYAIEDETWIFFDPCHSKQENKVWLAPGDHRPQVPRQVLMTTRKTLLLLAFTPNKRFSVRALRYGDTVNAEVYISFLQHTGNKWRCLRKDPVHLNELTWQHDNARPHTAAATKEYIGQRALKQLWQPPYSPDFNLCDRFVFHHLKNEFEYTVFNSHEEVENAALHALRNIDEKHFHSEVDALIEHCQAVINCNGNYVTD